MCNRRLELPYALWQGLLVPRRGTDLLWVLVTAAAIIALHLSAAAQTSKETRRVLILNDLGIISSPGFAVVDQALVAGLQKSPYHIELYQESLEVTLFPDEDFQRRFRQEFVRRYSERNPDVIIAAGSDSLKFLADLHEGFLQNTPVVFCAILGEIPDRLNSEMQVTGVLGRIRPDETLNVALRLLPRTKHVVVTGGMGKFDFRWEAIAKESFHSYESKLDFTYLTDLTMSALQGRLRNLPNNTIVYHTAISQDAAGQRFIDSSQAVPLVADAANAPVFVVDDVDLRDGMVGGYLVNWADDAYIAAGMAVRVLNGEKAQDIPVVTSNNKYMFDWRALKRWGMKESNLPPGSIMLNRKPGFWELYKEYVLIAVLVLLAQTVAILGLLWQRARRRRTEAELRRSEQKFSKSFRQSPLAICIASTYEDRYVEVNETFEDLTGWRRDEVAGRSQSDIKLWVDPDHRSAFLKQLQAQGNVRDLEVKIRRRDGQIRTTLGSAELIEVEGESCCLSVFADITERKQAEEALASVSHKLIEAQEKERTRIARELHDDINQRIALLAVELDQLQQSNPILNGEARSRMLALVRRVTEIGMEIQAISHRLHSSKLEILGVVSACRSFCREIGERHKVAVDFATDGVPRAVPEDVSLCLFRILQESLNNAIKHSGAEHFEVHLLAIPGEIQLAVRDHGSGFDAEAAMSSQGLGLISMRERASLVGGTMLISSMPTRGTEVSVRIPLLSAKYAGASEMTSGAA
jgi:PAS domain S-box-containing protein